MKTVATLLMVCLALCLVGCYEYQTKARKYNISANNNTVRSVRTDVHDFCAITRLSFNSQSPGQWKWGALTKNRDGTWTLEARSTTDGADLSVECYCFDLVKKN